MNVSDLYEDTSSRAGSRRWCFNVREGLALPYFSVHRDVAKGVYRIPAAYLAQARAITGVSGFREEEDLMRCWPSESVRELVSR